MICTPLKTSSPRADQPISYLNGQRHLAANLIVSPVEVPAETPQPMNGKMRSSLAATDSPRRRNKTVTSPAKLSVSMISTNGKQETPASSSTSLRDVSFLKICKAAYLAIKQSIAEDLTAPQELSRALQQAGFNPSRKRTMKHWRSSNSDGLTFSRFCDIADSERSENSPDLLAAFRKIDKDQSGLVAYNHLKHLMTTKGERMSEEEFNVVFRNSTFRKDSFFDYVSFCENIERTTQMCRAKGIESLNQREKQYEQNCSTYVIKRKDDAKKNAANCPPTATINNRTIDFPAFNITQDWSASQSQGCFYVNPDNKDIKSHQFLLNIESDTNVRLSIEPIKSKRRSFKLDMAAYVIRENDLNCRKLVAMTDSKDENGSFYFEAAMEAGSYVILPFTSGNPTEVRLEAFGPDGTPRTTGQKSAKLVVQQNYYNGNDTFRGPPRLSVEYREALEEMFSLIDLDGNGRISQSEFALFMLHSSDEEVTETEWRNLIGNLESESEEITLNGFIAIHQMELEHVDGNKADLLRTLHTMGFDERLELKSAFPYRLRVQAESPTSNPGLQVCACARGGPLLEKAICRAVLERGVATKVRNLNDLIAFTYTADHFATVIVQNKSHSPVIVRLDCTSSKNCRSHRGSLDFLLHVSPKSAMIGHHLVKILDKEQWQINCIESVIK